MPDFLFPDISPLLWCLVLGSICQAVIILVLLRIVWRRNKHGALLQANEERLKTAMVSGKNALWDWDIVSGRLEYSPWYWTMLGYDSAEIPGRIASWMNFIHPDDKDAVWRVNQDCVENRISQLQTEFRMQHKNGTWRWILSRGIASERDQSGRALRMIGMHTDITYHKELELAFRTDRDKMLCIFRALPIGIGVVTDGVISEVNACLSSMLGYTREELLGQNSRLLYYSDAEYKTVVRDNYRQVTERGVGRIATRFRRKNGHFQEILLHVAPLDMKKLSTGFTFAASDNSYVKDIQQQLQRAQEIEAIGSLAGGIAHDFNNILYPIIGLSEMILEDFHPGEAMHENILEILKAGRRGRELVTQILAFSRQGEHKMIPMRVQPVLKEVLKLCRASIPKSIEIQQDIQADTGLIKADVSQVHQMAMNLLTNAFHAVEQCDGMIRVGLQEKLATDDEEGVIGNIKANKRYVVLTVSDTGHGIPPELQDKIFKPYFTTKDQGKGTGLGLATVFGLVSAHEGDIRLTSNEEGGGTTFELFFPALNTTLPVEEKAPHSPTELRGTGSILLVDDEPAIAHLEKLMLEKLGYQVTERFSSTDALKAFEVRPDKFDLVITDMTMPGMTGDKLAMKLLKIRPDLPIVICTGYSDKINSENAVSLGVKGFLQKPVLRKDMADMVRRCLEDKEYTD
ncbi:MAG: hybrid sensor histidine kinase/response regulator [Desulfobulbus propionicus]|nr:MAG: hybrid sensor histidine kinase/response regulator [Desulfobulbus propionicus]